MTRLDQIKQSIEELTLEERANLARWFYDWRDDDWDRQMAGDVVSGKLRGMLSRIDADVEAGRLRDMP